VSEGKKSIGEGSKPGGGGEGGEEAANPTTKETEPSTAVAGTGEGGDAAAAGPPKESPGLGLLDGDDLNLDDEPTGPPPPPPISKEEASEIYFNKNDNQRLFHYMKRLKTTLLNCSERICQDKKGYRKLQNSS